MNKKNLSPSLFDSRPFLLKSATIFAVLCAVLLILGKAFAYFRSQALSIEASLLDSCLDCIISVINFFAVRHALIPADSDHGYGHGKIEALAGLLQALFIAGSGIWLLKEVVFKLINPEPLVLDKLSLIVLGGASILTTILVLFQKFVISKTHSVAIEADCLHYQTDLFANIGVLLSLFVTNYLNAPILDALTAGIFVFYILKTAYKIGRTSFDILMDRELSDEELNKITSVLSQIISVENIHHMKTRSCGQTTFIQLDISLDGTLSLKESDLVSQKIKDALTSLFLNAEIVIQKRSSSEVKDFSDKMIKVS